jgi:uncharacterized membrane protein
MTTDKKIPSLEELRVLCDPLINVNKAHYENLTRLEKLALWATIRIGSIGFFFFILIFNIVWIAWNVYAPPKLVFDPAWSFLILLFINNILQILFLPLIMVGQNLQGRYAEFRAEADFQTNKKAERKIEVIIQHLEAQDKKLDELMKKLSN